MTFRSARRPNEKCVIVLETNGSTNKNDLAM